MTLFSKQLHQSFPLLRFISFVKFSIIMIVFLAICIDGSILTNEQQKPSMPPNNTYPRRDADAQDNFALPTYVLSDVLFSGHCKMAVTIYNTRKDEKGTIRSYHLGTGIVYDKWHVITAARLCWKFYTKEESLPVMMDFAQEENGSDVNKKRNLAEYYIPDEYITSEKIYHATTKELPPHDVCLIRVDRPLNLGEESGILAIDQIATNPTPESVLKDSIDGRILCAMINYGRKFIYIVLYRWYFIMYKRLFLSTGPHSRITSEYYGKKNQPLLQTPGDLGGFIFCPLKGTKMYIVDTDMNKGYMLMGIITNFSVDFPKEDRDFTVSYPIQYSRDWIIEKAASFRPTEKSNTTTTSTSTSTSTMQTESKSTISPSKSSSYEIILIVLVIIIVGCVGVYLFLIGRKTRIIKGGKTVFGFRKIHSSQQLTQSKLPSTEQASTEKSTEQKSTEEEQTETASADAVTIQKDHKPKQNSFEKDEE